MTVYRTFVLCVALGVCGVGFAGFAEDLPEPLRYIETLEGDEGKLVDAVRRFGLQQKSLIEWDQRLAEEYMKSGEPDLAATKQDDIRRRVEWIGTAWTYVLDRYPNNPRANNYYGEYLYDFRGQQMDALSHWRKAMQLDPEYAPPYNNMGIHNFHRGEYERGLTQLEKALELDPENPDYLYNMVQMYMIHFPQIGEIKERSREKLYKDAMKMAAKAADIAPDDFDIVQDHAVSFFAAENFGVEPDWEAAADAWKRVVPLARSEDEQFYALLNLGRVLLRSDAPRRAAEPIERALELRPNNEVAKRLLDEARRSAG